MESDVVVWQSIVDTETGQEEYKYIADIQLVQDIVDLS